jgi:IAA-amino acid hydrolase
MLTRAHDLAETLVAFRRDLHQHPELSFQEHRTSQQIAQRLTELGVDVRAGIAKTGVVADLGQAGPCVALRADIDALPIQEENDVPYASQVPGVMHACGHDVHAAWLLGAAYLLAEEAAAGRLSGRVRFLFQPAEEAQDAEGLSGAMRMVAEGAMEGVDAVFGLHVWTELETGRMSLREGPASAYPDKFELVIHGQWGHGAFPHLGMDAISLSAQVITALQTVVSRRLDPTRGKVLTVGTIQGGTKDNILAGKVTMTGTIRTFEPETRQQLLAEMDRACQVARTLGGDYELRIVPGYLPTINDPALTAFLRSLGEELLGPENVMQAELQMGGEDFAYFAREAPGCFAFLGAARPGQSSRMHHDSHFDVDERCLPIGAALLAEAALRHLATAT